jgi:hypothetical protein
MTMTKILLTCVLLWLAGCADNLQVPRTNITPVADARVLDQDGRTVMLAASGGGTTSVTLDGSHSRDADGSVARYRWLSSTLRGLDGGPAGAEGDAADGGGPEPTAGTAAKPPPGRWIPTDADPGWPDDVQQPQVTLGPGDYAFTLWVIDDRGEVSEPSTITIVVAR